MLESRGVRRVASVLIVVTLLSSGAMGLATLQTSWHPLSANRLQTRVGDTNPNPITMQWCCVYGNYTGCIPNNPPLQCQDPSQIHCTNGLVYYGACSNAWCKFTGNNSDGCAVQTGSRQVGQCTMNGQTTPNGCQNNQVRCDITKIGIGEPGCPTVQVPICSTDPSLTYCDQNSQPPQPCVE